MRFFCDCCNCCDNCEVRIDLIEPCMVCDDNYQFSVYRKITKIKNSIYNIIRFDFLSDVHDEMHVINNGMVRN